MKNILYTIILSFLFSFSVSIKASPILKVYDCPLGSNAYKLCNNSCLHDKNLSLTKKFVVNPQNQKGIIYTYARQSLVNSAAMENCTIVDEENWVCDNYWVDGTTKVTVVMANGRAYTKLHDWRVEESLGKRSCYK